MKNYGIMLRIQYKQKLSHWIAPLLEQDEYVFQLSGNDLILRFNTESHQQRIEALDKHIRQFRFVWDGMPCNRRLGSVFAMFAHPLTTFICYWGS